MEIIASGNRAERKRMAVKRRRERLLLIVGGTGVILALIGWTLVASLRQANQPAVGQNIPIQGNDHIDVGEAHPKYNSDPPTSGWHYAQPADAGVYNEPIADEYVVHSLEHGYVAISYDCQKLPDCDQVKEELQKIFNDFQGWKIIVVPRINVDAAIALTAWGRIEKMETFDKEKIIAFIHAWRNMGPEHTET